MFVIKKGEREKLFNRQAKQNIINALLNAMDKHRRVLVVCISLINVHIVYSIYNIKHNYFYYCVCKLLLNKLLGKFQKILKPWAGNFPLTNEQYSRVSR